MKKFIIYIITATILIYFFYIKNLNFDAIIHQKFPSINNNDVIIQKEVPNDIKDLLALSKIKHSVSTKTNNSDFFKTHIELDSMIIEVFKYKISKPIDLDKINIKFKATHRTNLVFYETFMINNWEIAYRHIKNIDTLLLYTQKPFDTIIFNNRELLFKGRLKSLSFVLQKKKKIKTISITNNIPLSYFFKKTSPYYLLINKRDNFLYIIFIKVPIHDDNKVLRLIS